MLNCVDEDVSNVDPEVVVSSGNVELVDDAGRLALESVEIGVVDTDVAEDCVSTPRVLDRVVEDSDSELLVEPGVVGVSSDA